ncbi:MAG: class F sortase, partial [Nocardioidaceae bacterium]|nr:class F sortase [Nocardioidaceae bacterium]
GALARLGALEQGDRVTLRVASGTVRYAVSSVRVFAKPALAQRSARVFRQDGPAGLALVTCTGWDGTRFTSNVVVVAEPVTARR